MINEMPCFFKIFIADLPSFGETVRAYAHPVLDEIFVIFELIPLPVSIFFALCMTVGEGKMIITACIILRVSFLFSLLNGQLCPLLYFMQKTLHLLKIERIKFAYKQAEQCGKNSCGKAYAVIFFHTDVKLDCHRG